MSNYISSRVLIILIIQTIHFNMLLTFTWTKDFNNLEIEIISN